MKTQINKILQPLNMNKIRSSLHISFSQPSHSLVLPLRICKIRASLFFLLCFLFLGLLTGCSSVDKSTVLAGIPTPVMSQDKNSKTEEDSASVDITPTEPVTSDANPSIPGTPLPSSDNTASSIICTPVPTVSPSSQVTLLAVGDNLIHIEVVESGEQEDGSLNYDHLYSNLKDEISAADIAIVNQETILGGNDFKYSGYPVFNSPTEIGDALITAGFDVILQATNHTMDMGEKGIDHAIAYWKEHPGIVTLGINESQEDSEKITIIEKNGIKIAILNYTYSLNGYSLPADKPYLVNMLDKDKMEQDIRKAEKMADFTIVFPHWGTEYVYTATSSQEDLTSFYYDLGVDLVIGSHPHVLEPVEWIETEKDHKMLVYYSLGNFLSYQKEAPRMLGGIASVTITKDESGTYISDADITPIVTHYEHGPADYNYGIYKLSDYSEALASVHGVSDIAQQGSLTYQKTVDLAKKVLGSWYQ